MHGLRERVVNAWSNPLILSSGISYFDAFMLIVNTWARVLVCRNAGTRSHAYMYLVRVNACVLRHLPSQELVPDS